MKKIYALFSIPLFIFGCNDILDYRNAEISNGKIYTQGANTPYNGRLTNIPFVKLPTSDIANSIRLFNTTVKDSAHASIFFPIIIQGLNSVSQNKPVLCDLQISQGLPDGEVKCGLENSEYKFLKFSYSKGSANGDFIFYNLNKPDSIVAKFRFENGKENGEFLVNSPKTGKLIHRSTWINGIANGAEESFDTNTGKLIFKATLANGKYDGVSESYSSDGVLTKRLNWKSGVLIPEEPNTTERCEDLWMSAFRKENGEDSIISTEQLSEWEDWCKDGKKPNK